MPLKPVRRDRSEPLSRVLPATIGPRVPATPSGTPTATTSRRRRRRARPARPRPRWRRSSKAVEDVGVRLSSCCARRWVRPAIVSGCLDHERAAKRDPGTSWRADETVFVPDRFVARSREGTRRRSDRLEIGGSTRKAVDPIDRDVVCRTIPPVASRPDRGPSGDLPPMRGPLDVSISGPHRMSPEPRLGHVLTKG